MAAIRFSASDCRWPQSSLVQQQLAADRTFDPRNLPFFCCSGYPGVSLGAAEADLFALAQVVLPAALGLPTHSYPPHVSSLPTLSACSAAAFATTVASSAPTAKPSNGLCLYHPFTGVPCSVPSGQIIPVCFIWALHAQSELLRPVWPLIGAAEVAHESFLKVQPTIYTSCRQVVQPDSCRSYQE